jgi:hypothetical protein
LSTVFPLEGTTPLVADRFINTYLAGATITVGQLLYLSTDLTVKPTTSANLLTVVGIALTNASSGQKVSVVSRGVCRATAYGAISAGDQLTSASGGSAGLIQTDNASKNTSVIGLALQTLASGATGLILLW